MNKKIKTVLCGAVAAIATTAALSGNNFTFAAKAADMAADAKFAINPGAFSLRMDDSVTETVRYKHTESYLYNKRDTNGNINLGFTATSVSSGLSGTDFYGLVRGKSKDIAYAYVGDVYWYVFGAGNPGKGDVTIYKEGARTDISYDVTSHTFSVVVDGEDQAANMAKFVSSATAETADNNNATKICWDATNTNKTFDVTLEDFSITDADGYDLGIELSARAAASDKVLEEKYYAYAGKTVTIKLFGADGESMPAALDKDGNRADVKFTAGADGEYTFVMPDEEITLVAYTAVNDDRYYGTYYDSASDVGYIFGETNYRFGGGVKSEVSVKAFDIGVATITDGETSAEGEFDFGNLTIGGTAYKKLLSYKVDFVVDGKSVKTVTVDSGDYILTDPGLAPTKDGYTFVGWKTGKNETFVFGKTTTSSVTLYADFRSDEEHKDPAEEKSGCGSNAIAGIAILPMTAIAAFTLKKKGKRQ